MNINININENRSVLQTKYPRPQQCPNNKVLYRVTFGYKSNLTKDNIFPVTYENFDDSFQKKTNMLNPGDLVKYTPKNKKDPNYNRDALITKSTNRYAKREAQERGLEVSPDKDKNSFYDIKFVNPVVAPNNEIIKTKNQVSRLNKDGSVQLSKIQDEVESYVCEEPFVAYFDIRQYIDARNRVRNGEPARAELRAAENRLWPGIFHLDDNNEPQYPLMRTLTRDMKERLDREVENMVKVGFLLGKKEMRPEIKKTRNGFTLSFLMPKGARPGDTITVPVIKGKGKKRVMVEIVVQIPITTGNDNHSPKTNEYIKDVAIDKELNSGVYDNLKSMKSKEDVDTKFKPTYIKASEYVGPDTQKDLDMLVKPGSTQEYFINSATIIPQEGNKFIFKKLTSFDKESQTLVFDLYVLVKLELILKLKGPEDAADDSFGGKLSRTVTAGILNSPSNCPSYMARAKRGAAELLSNLKPPRTFGQIIRARNQRLSAERAQIGRDIRGEERRILQNRFSGRENVRRGGGPKVDEGMLDIQFAYFWNDKWKDASEIDRPPIKEFVDVMKRIVKKKATDSDYEKWKIWFNDQFLADKDIIQATIIMLKEQEEARKIEMTSEEQANLVKTGAFGGVRKRRSKSRKKTKRKRKKCIRKATKRLNKCWRKKKRKTFKKCWKKGRKKYKACKKKTKRRR